MDFSENIQVLASFNAKGFAPKRKEDIYKDVPYFEIYKNDYNKYEVRGYNYENHDNNVRMKLYEWYLSTSILPNVTGNVCGFYNIELHDSYTYLPKKEHGYKDVLTFSKFKNDASPVLLPDPYMVGNWGGHVQSIVDNVPWEQKQDKAYFFGTTTGNRDPTKNARIKFCIDNIGNDKVTAKITKVAQMTQDDIISSIGSEKYSQIVSSSMVSPQEQMKCKYQLSLDGNTCRFDVWNYFTDCMTLKMQSNEMLWYYPMLMDNVHYTGFSSVSDIHRTMMRFNNNKNDAKRIVENAKLFAKSVFKPMTCMQYTTALFEAVAENK
jgi:hypothetical protein